MITFVHYYVSTYISDYNKQNHIEPMDSLGNLLNNKFVTSILKYDLKLDDTKIKRISEINKLGNSYKHKSYIQIIDEECIHAIELVYIILSQYYEVLFNEKIDVFIRTMLNNHDKFEQQVNTNTDKNIDVLLKYQRLQLEELLEENDKLMLQKTQLESDAKRIEENLNEYEALKSEYAQLSTKYVLLQKEAESSDYNEVETSAQLELINDRLNELKSEDLISSDVKLHNKMLQIEHNTQKVNKIIKIHENLNEINKLKNINAYNGYEEVSKYFSITIPYSYKNGVPFSLLGIAGVNRCTSKYKSYYGVVFNQLIRGYNINPSQFLLSYGLEDHEIITIYRLQMSVLSLLKNNQLDDAKWNLNLMNSDRMYLEIAISDIFNRIETLNLLSNTPFEKPSIQINQMDTVMEDSINISFLVIYPKNNNVITISEDITSNNQIDIWIDDKIDYKINDQNRNYLNIFLKDLFGFDQFKPGQVEILINVLNGKSTIGILTTSGGKSLIYQYYALMQPKITIVVDPINSLIEDQYRMLAKFNLNQASRLITHNEAGSIISAKFAMEKFFYNPTLFAFCSPERFQDAIFRNWLIVQSNENQIGLIVLDEVHCLSEWGHDFRIAYLMLTHTINTYCKNIQYLGLTATAAINVIKDLQVELGVFEPKDVVYARKLQRNNLYFHIRQEKKFEDMMNTLESTLDHDYNQSETSFNLKLKEKNGYIIFFKTIALLDKMYAKFSKLYINETAEFHSRNKKYQEEFINDRKTLLLATKSFGMGIDKPNIRKTIHFGMPVSKEAFFQEAGRAGRDDNPATCLLLTFQSDLKHNQDIKDFLDLNTSIDNLKKTQKNMGHMESNDLSPIAYFITLEIDEPVVEAEKAEKLYNYILKNQVNENVVIEISKEKKNIYQKNLYILHKAGIVRNWTIKFKPNDIIKIGVHLHPKLTDIDHVKEVIYNYIYQYSPNSKYLEKIHSFNKIEELKDLIIIMRLWYQNTFIRSKREQLANMIDFIDRYKNDDKNVEIQSELSEFFDISKLLVKRDSEGSLTFDQATIIQTLQKAVRIKKDELESSRINMERLLETEDSNKISLFTSLIYLRLGMFSNRNGRDRLLFSLRESNQEDVILIYQNINSIYRKLSSEQKEELIKTLFEFNQEYLLDYLDADKLNDEIVSLYLIKCINSKYERIFSEVRT